MGQRARRDHHHLQPRRDHCRVALRSAAIVAKRQGAAAPDQGCYEERYRLTFPVARSAAISFAALIPALSSHQPLPWLILFLLGFALSTVPWVLAVASRKIAFRADMAGITLGADPLSWPFRHASAVSVPWADIEGIILYPGGGSIGWGSKQTLGIGLQRRPGAPAFPRGNKPARRCLVPGVAAGAVRPVSACRLDRERLAALTAAVAPAVPITEASAGAPPGVEGPDPAGNATEPGPAG